MHPSPPLPSNWQNLYRHTMSIHHLRFETRPEDYVACSRISSEDMVYYDAAYYTDGAIAYERQQKYERQSKSLWRRLLSLHKSSTDTRSSPQPVRAVEVAEEPYDLSASFSRVMEKAERGSGDAPTAQIESAPHASSITGPDPSLAVKVFNELGEIAVRIAGDLFGYEDPYDRFIPIDDYSLDLLTVTELADGRLLDEDLAALRLRIQKDAEERLELASKLVGSSQLSTKQHPPAVEIRTDTPADDGFHLSPPPSILAPGRPDSQQCRDSS
ncbi:hypothetical protein FA95DRAFT_618168 [Auriscalpium vulgare]|uniref:Uncharacterized protein n=1 Tax=Auriscalpium vulgare TaxID=40419 RepID=A0ACB8RDX2_9AGAM|nr:hypothetical protein FA95DRAFT_618168 [Auriscalpium vulgare]